MIDKFKFESLIKDLEGRLGSIDKDKKIRDSKIEYYYEDLRRYDYHVLKKAIDYLCSHWTGYKSQRFPLPGHITEQCDNYLKESPMATINELNEYSCDKCNSTGFMLEDYKFTEKPYTMAVCCDCKKGQIMRQSAENVISKRNQGKPLF